MSKNEIEGQISIFQPKKRSRVMTPEEREAYDELVKNSKQASIFDYLQ